MKKNEKFIGDNAYLAPNMEMIEVETENSFASTVSGGQQGSGSGSLDTNTGGVAPLADDFSDLLDF